MAFGKSKCRILFGTLVGLALGADFNYGSLRGLAY